MLQIVISVFVLPFFAKKRQDKIAREQQSLLNLIKPNQEVLLTCGVYGKIVAKTKTDFKVEISPNTVIRVRADAILGFFDAKVAADIVKKTTAAEREKNIRKSNPGLGGQK